MKEFLRAAERHDEESIYDPIKIGDVADPVEIQIRRPSPSQFAVLLGTLNGFADGRTQAATLVNFLYGIVHPDDKNMVRQLLLDADYPFEIDDIQDILEGMTEVWSERPTQPSSGSSGSRGRTGPKSTAKRPKEITTRSTSRSTDS